MHLLPMSRFSSARAPIVVPLYAGPHCFALRIALASQGTPCPICVLMFLHFTVFIQTYGRGEACLPVLAALAVADSWQDEQTEKYHVLQNPGRQILIYQNVPLEYNTV